MLLILETIRHWVSQNWMILAAGVGLVIYGYFRSTQRSKEWEEKAGSLNLQFLERSLPDDLSLDGTNLSGSNFSVNNVVAGVVRGIHLAAFEVTEKAGEDTIRQTDVSFLIDGRLQGHVPPNEPSGTYCFVQSGRWLLGWVPARLVNPDEFEDWCTELYDLAARLVSEQGLGFGSSELASRLFREF